MGALTSLGTPNAAHPALAVKIDNSPAARPQAGLDKADVVFDEMVEGGEVRFMAVFQSQDAPSVGPVRSVRPVDPDIVSPLGGLFAYSRGAPQFTALIKEAPVTLVGFDELSEAYTKRRDRRPPPTSTPGRPRSTAGPGTTTRRPRPSSGSCPPAPSSPRRGPWPPPHLTVNVTSRVRADWDFDAAAKLWRRGTNSTPHTVESGAQLGFTNVVVQFVAYRDSGSRDVAGNPVPDADVVGEGQAIVLSDGKMAQANWSKSSAAAATTYTDSAGAPLALSPGTTWVTSAPTGAATSTG